MNALLRPSRVSATSAGQRSACEQGCRSPGFASGSVQSSRRRRAGSQRFTGRRLLPATVFLCLSACVTPRGVELPTLDGWQQRQQVLSNVSEWAFSGRVGVQSGEEGFNGKLRWHQDRDDFEASVSGPFGAGRVTIEGDGKSIAVAEPGGEVTRLEDPDLDLRARYGWTIPVTSLRYWALGIPDPDLSATTEFGADGLLAHLSQAGWDVNIGQYRDAGGQPMPRRITARRGDSRVRLVIDSWTFYDLKASRAIR